MKTWTSIVICFVLTSGLSVKAQNMLLAAQSEYTIAGPQFGGTVGFELKNKLGVGVIWQREINKMPEASTVNQLSAAYLQLPLVNSQKLSFLFNTRVGLSNEKYFVVIPGLETRVQLTKRSGVAFGMSMRMHYPSLSAKVYTNLF